MYELVAAYLGVKPKCRVTTAEIVSEAPEGCLTIEQLERIVAANGLPA